MILYFLWGLVFAVLYHLAMVATEQDAPPGEILLVITAWPIMLLIFIWSFIVGMTK